MNKIRQLVDGIWRAGLVVAAGGTVLASSCSTSEVQAVLSGVEFVADQFSSDGSSSFGHWLSNALDD